MPLLLAAREHLPCPLRRSHQNVGALKPSGKHRAEALCIKAEGVLGMPQSREAGLSGTLENRNKPDIRKHATWLLGEQVDQVG